VIRDLESPTSPDLSAPIGREGSALTVFDASTAKLPISAYVICKNEERHIARCLASLAACAEIIVVDSGSTDGTLAIVRELIQSGLPVRLMHQDWLGYAAQKQFALEQTHQPWCLSLDADERLDARLQGELPRLLSADASVAAWRLKRLPTSLFGAGRVPHGVYPKPVLRLTRRGRARYDIETLVHEHIHVDGRVRDCRYGVIEHEKSLALEEQLRKEMLYARLKATQRFNHGQPPSLLRLVFNPVLYFLRLYLMHRWFLAGRPGFVHAVTGAIYAFATEATHFELWRARPRR
jgi:glycosyltransferase involved in cell wall biosynthesis